jgi:hypothetical protein
LDHLNDDDGAGVSHHGLYSILLGSPRVCAAYFITGILAAITGWYVCTNAPNIFRKVFNTKKPLLRCG